LAAVDAVEDGFELDLCAGVDPGRVAEGGGAVEIGAGGAVEADQVGGVLLAVRNRSGPSRCASAFWKRRMANACAMRE
ncbi:MAG TPA: hypothetical protein VLF66_11365, partial [Thermoanaerobaculia bacterium]|nr:hypothetical protein [Thermoanaerobaculia bacterium]